MVTEAQVLGALSNIIDPDLHKDVVSLGFIKNLKIDGGQVSFDFELTTPACPVKDRFLEQARHLVGQLPGVERVDCTMTSNVRPSGGAGRSTIQLPGVKNVVAVGAGKGGVGKSTCAVGLAVALRQTGATVGLLDADIHGPNIPLMMGLSEPPHQEANRIIPGLSHDVKIMSDGSFVQENLP